MVFCCQGVNTKWEYWSKMGQLNSEQVSVCWVVYSKFPVVEQKPVPSNVIKEFHLFEWRKENWIWCNSIEISAHTLREAFRKIGLIFHSYVFLLLLHLPSSQLSNFTSKHDKGLPARPFEWSHSGKKDIRHNKICNYPTRKASLIKYVPPNIPNASNFLILYSSRPFQMTCIW